MGQGQGRRFLRMVPPIVGFALLLVMVLAGLLPNAGVVSASSNCTYGQCPAVSPFPVWEVSVAAIASALILIAALLWMRQRRRRPPEGGGVLPPGGTGLEGGSGPEGSGAAEPSDRGFEEPQSTEETPGEPG